MIYDPKDPRAWLKDELFNIRVGVVAALVVTFVNLLVLSAILAKVVRL